MDKSLLLLSPLVILLIHADSPAFDIQLPEATTIIEQAAPGAKLDPTPLSPASQDQQPAPESMTEPQPTEVTPPLETHMMPPSEDRLATLECELRSIQEQLCNCCQPFLSHPHHSFYVWGEWIYWKFTEGGTEFAIDPVPATVTLTSLRGSTQKVEFNWTSGFRLGIGYHFEEEGWDLSLYYTQIDPQGHKKITTPVVVVASRSSDPIYPLLLFSGNNTTVQVSSASAKWDINYKTLDFEIGRIYNVARTLSFRPFFGMKAARIDQHSRFIYGNQSPAFADQIPVGGTDTVRFKNDFEGIGLKAGLGTKWLMSECYGLSLYGNSAFSLLVSEIEVENKQDEWVALGTDFIPNNVDFKSKFHPLLPVVDLAFGIEWEKGFCCDRYRIGLHAGIEGQYWWRQNYLEIFGATVTDPYRYVRPIEDLGIYGLDVGLRFDF